ncbi:hypothetical protein FCL47_23360 [Desulfopila sp. IMCC35006]|uniref:O-antigen ligase family protein n=1 Tax=Desulfopila sp. IMCC35006 TaxID=2569542 RepID=UPI0010AB8A7C|nr:O-antigen ligase family protein [Desulfopila sp. IMCC35006]TKB23216.1 hypothetical protein FCL47_23360 [Desulfopila sp. IMCC35006]
MNYFVITIVSILLFAVANKNYAKGMAFATFFLVSLPHCIRIELPGVLPEMTIHRIVILILFSIAIQKNILRKIQLNTPFFRLIILIFFSNLLSGIFSIDPGLSIKDLLATFFENFLLFIIIINTIHNKSDIINILISASLGLGAVALLTFFEYYEGVNYVTLLFPAHAAIDRTGAVIGSFQHQIHLGYIMAMIFPVSFLLILNSKKQSEKFLFFLLTTLQICSCYFSFSRGPWGLAILTGFILLFLSDKQTKKRLLALGLILSFALVFNPGVRTTIVEYLNTVLPHEGKEDASAEYRIILWKVAFAKTNESSERFLLGYGGQSTSLMDISSYFEKERGGQVMSQGFSSWDSAWASHLVQYGWVGLSLELILHLSIYKTLLEAIKKSRETKEGPLVVGVLTGCLVFSLGMLTVSMFSPQLKYLFWALVSSGIILGSNDKIRLRPILSKFN